MPSEHFAPRSRRTFVRRRLAAGALAGAVVAAAIALPLATLGAGPAGGWTIVTSPSTSDGGSDFVLGSTCANAQECWFVGVDIVNINSQRSTVLPLVGQWDGSNWSLASTPDIGQGGFFGVTCVTTSDCWAVGATVDVSTGNPSGPLTEHWDGSAWHGVPAPNPPGAAGTILHSVSCASSTDCWAVGSTLDTNGTALNSVVLMWNGSTWNLGAPAATGQPFDQLNSVDCLSPSDCWAVGAAGPQQEQSDFLPILPGAIGNQGLTEHYDGAQWTMVPSYSQASPDGGWLSAVTCVAGDDCWATGATTGSGGTANAKLAEQWNGTAWSVVPTPQQSGTNGILTGVTCLGPTQCWASGMVGDFTFGGGGNGFQPTPELEAWNGTAWSVQPSPNVTTFALTTTVACVRADGCWVAGSSATNLNQNTQFVTLVEQLVLPAASSQGFEAAAADGGVFNFGTARYLGSMGGRPLNRPVVGIAATPDGGGYWEVASDGGIFSFGNATFHGSMGGRPLNRPVVGIAATPDGGGYWEVASDGGIFSFGDASFYGSMGGVPLREPVVGMAPAPDGNGYWEVAADGGVFAFGSARFLGSMGGTTLRTPVVGLTPTPNGRGYWEAGADGGVFTFGNAPFEGSVPGQGITARAPISALVGTPDGQGYWEIGWDGALYTYGDAAFLGSLVGLPLAAPVVGAAS
jgi:hypothetical protein